MSPNFLLRCYSVLLDTIHIYVEFFKVLLKIFDRQWFGIILLKLLPYPPFVIAILMKGHTYSVTMLSRGHMIAVLTHLVVGWGLYTLILAFVSTWSVLLETAHFVSVPGISQNSATGITLGMQRGTELPTSSHRRHLLYHWAMPLGIYQNYSLLLFIWLLFYYFYYYFPKP